MIRITRSAAARPRLFPLPRPRRTSPPLPRGPVLAEVLEERLALAVFAVTNTNDTGAGSFRQAIRDANVGTGADTIVFDAAYFSTPREILVHNYPEQFGGVSGPLTVIGPGSSLLTIRPGNMPNPVYARALDSYAPVLTMSGMTVTGGNSTANGGGLSCTANSDVTLEDMVFVDNVANNGGAIALSNNATLTLRNCRVTGNRAGLGGGIFFFNGGSLVMDDCTLSGNSTTRVSQYDASGGGIYFYGSAKPAPLPPGFLDRTLLIKNSTLSGNAAFGGGGGVALDWLVGTMLLQNSTISGNTAGSSGGGIYNINQPATLTLENATVTGNSAGQTAPLPNARGGGGIARVSSSPGAINVTNSVVSGNTNAATPDILASPQSPVTVGFGAVGSAAGFTIAPASHNNVPFGANLLLGPLANNGGRTLTHQPQAGSPLINAGGNALVPAGLTFDQRGPGFPRVVGATVDIGSVESPHAAPAPQVRRVFFSNTSAWAAAFRSYMEAQGVGDATHGYVVPAGADQLDPLPWVGLNRVSIRFSQNVAAGLNHLSVTGVSVASYPMVNFGYDPSTFTATWDFLQPLRNDRLTLNLDGDTNGVASAGGGPRLDGNNDGTAGGDFLLRVNVLPGDADQNFNRVNAADQGYVKARLNRSTTSPTGGAAAYSIFADVTGDGRINAADQGAVKARLNNTLPVAVAQSATATAMPPALFGEGENLQDDALQSLLA